MMPSKGWQRSRGASSLIEQVIPPRIDFKRIPTKSVHYASEPSTGLFRTPFRMNLGPLKPYAVIKGIGWLEKQSILIGNCFYVLGPNPRAGGFRHSYLVIESQIQFIICRLSMSLHCTDHQVTAITCHLCKRMGSNILYTLIKMYRDA
jgi:hypothetical protein